MTRRQRNRDGDEPPRYSDPLTEIELRADAEGRVPQTTAEPGDPISSSEPAAMGAASSLPPVLGAGSAAAGGKKRLGDRIFGGATTGAGILVIALIALIAIFLLIKAIPAIANDHSNFLFSRDWSVDSSPQKFGVLPMLYTTVLVSLVALVIAVPLSIGIALFMSHYVSKRFARPIGYVIDLLAAVPSIIYGVWGIYEFAPALQHIADGLTSGLSWFPLFADESVTNGTVFVAGVVLAVMILPIVTAVCRDVFERTPRHNIEAALALGATRWEMIRMTVLPYGRAGIVSGAMLGLGRALGETIAIALILSKVSSENTGPFIWSIFNGGETFASKITNNYAEFNSASSTAPYLAAGLVLFALTFIVNAIARAIVNRRKEFS